MRVPGQTSATAPGAATNAITIIRPGVIILRAEHFSGLSHRSLGHGVVTTGSQTAYYMLAASFYLTTRGHAALIADQNRKKINREIFFAIKHSHSKSYFVFFSPIHVFMTVDPSQPLLSNSACSSQVPVSRIKR